MAGNIKKSVVDASFILAYLFPQERTSIIERIMLEYKEGERELFSPQLLPFEVINSIKYSKNKKRFREGEAERIVKAFLKLNIFYEEIDFEETFDLAIKNNLTVYDAAYLSLSLKKGFPLLSLDKHLTNIYK